jgi:hypothetical protein
VQDGVARRDGLAGEELDRIVELLVRAALPPRSLKPSTG